MNPFARLFKVNWLAVVLATLAGFAIGWLWYGILFSSTWEGLTGNTAEVIEASGASMPLTFGISILACFVVSWGLAVLIGKAPAASNGLMTGVFVALFFLVALLAQNYVYSLHPLGLWLVDAGYFVVLLGLMGAVIGAMRKPI